MLTPIIVFDLDGTLVDTAPDLVDTLNTIFAREGIPAVDYDTARNLIGGGARRMLERGLSEQGRDCAPAVIDYLFDDFIAYYSDHIADRSRAFPGLEAALDTLSAQGFRFAVCTNKLEGLSLLLLDALGMRSRFAFICGQDTFGIAKPSPEPLRRTIAAAGGDPARALMVGDSHADIATARAAGIPVIAVDFGYTETPVTELGPDLVISHFDALPAAVDRLLAGAPVATNTNLR